MSRPIADAPAGVATVPEHLERVLREITPLAPIEIGLHETLGHVLAEDVVAAEPLPAYTAALRAGYAVAAADVATASGESPAVLRAQPEGAPVGGGLTRAVVPGGEIPEGADAVVPLEAAQVQGDAVEVVRPVAAGANVRHAGSDLRPGEVALRTGRRLRPGDVAVLAALGLPAVRCHPQPRAVILTGGTGLPAEQAIRDSNGPMLLALLRQAGALPFPAGAVGEDRRSIIDAIDSNLGHADLLVVVGITGLVADVLDMLGEVRPTRVAMSPGRSQIFGRVRGIPIFGLPGHPASSFISFEMFVRPVIRRMQGRGDLSRPKIRARLAQEVHTDPGVLTCLRVRLERKSDGWVASLAGSQSPHDLRSLAAADGIAEIPLGVETVSAGEQLTVHLLVEP